MNFSIKSKFLSTLLLVILISTVGYVCLNSRFLGYSIRSFGASLKRTFMQEDIKTSNYPNKLKLLWDQIKILYKLNLKGNKSIDFYNKENIAGYEVVFTDYLSLQIVFNDIFFAQEYFFQTDSKEPFIIDCGSNIGLATLFFKSLYPNSKILAFEPSQKNFESLEQNISNNNLKNVTAIKKGVYDKRIQLKFALSGTPSSSSQRRDYLYVDSDCEKIETDLLSDYINERVDLLKIDIEGAEGLVLQDLAKNNKFQYIDQIIIEYHPNMKNNKLSKIIKTLERNKYYYQVSSPLRTPFKKNINIAFLIHAYKKK